MSTTAPTESTTTAYDDALIYLYRAPLRTPHECSEVDCFATATRCADIIVGAHCVEVHLCDRHAA